ncbi:MAG TPA: 4Fe-4S dicluster domain-containing protein [Dehalococcoidia bacterium]|nr:4Fe-4S dicluster domain-containing protein [Dehalococcoidia bacterium]
MTYKIELDGCINCGWCRRACPTQTIHFFLTHRRMHVVEPDGCIDCAICQQVCPVNVVWHDPSYEPPPEKLEAARERARAFARKQRAVKLQLRSRAERTLQRLAEHHAAAGTAG